MISIVIPTYNNVEDLKKCIESIHQYTDMDLIEIIVVANGCKDSTADYIKSLSHHKIILIEFEEAIGYVKATNHGILAANGNYVLLLNDDTVLLPQELNQWINMLLEPFNTKPKVGVSGPVKFWWQCGEIKRNCIAFWCALIPIDVIQEIGLLDETFSPGMGEDGDFCIKAELAGYSLEPVPQEDGSRKFGEGVGHGFPIYHKGSSTFSKDPEKDELIKRNSKILEDRYGKL